jgi:hypothetical protein
MTSFTKQCAKLALAALDAGDPEKAVKLLLAGEATTDSSAEQQNFSRAAEEADMGSVEKATNIIQHLIL